MLNSGSARPAAPGDKVRRGSIVDGFQYNLFLRNFPENYYPLALSQLEPFRRARGYRPRWYTVPDADTLATIPPYGAVEEQIRIAPGSWLWGMSVTVRGAAFGVADPSGVLAIQITDGSTGLKLFSDFMSAGFIWTQGWGPAPPYLWIDNSPYILSQPRPIVEPGLVNVEIADTLGPLPGWGIQQAQLVLYCMEPAIVIEEQLTNCRKPALLSGASRGIG